MKPARPFRHRRTTPALLGWAVIALLLQLIAGTGVFAARGGPSAAGDRYDFASAICSTAPAAAADPVAGGPAPDRHEHRQCTLCCAGVALAVDTGRPLVSAFAEPPARCPVPRAEPRPFVPHWSPDGARAPPAFA